VPDLPIPGVTDEVLSNGVHGFVGGNRMHFLGGAKIRAGDSEGAITLDYYITAVFDLEGTNLVGEASTETKFSCTGFMTEFCPQIMSQHVNATLSRIGTVQSGTYSVTGRWEGEQMLQLQDNGGSISGSVVAADIAEQSVTGRNDNNRITLRVRFTTRENTGSVDYSRTVERFYELTAYEPSSISGFMSGSTTERCTAKSSSAASFCAERNKTVNTQGRVDRRAQALLRIGRTRGPPADSQLKLRTTPINSRAASECWPWSR
jgi:hypothetical protein